MNVLAVLIHQFNKLTHRKPVTVSLDDLYIRHHMRCNRLKRFRELAAPKVIISREIILIKQSKYDIKKGTNF